jgi:O-antigen/teichoic acid export membrane protein
MYATFAGMLVNLILGVILVPSLGLTGSGIAFASSIIFWNAVMVVMSRRFAGVNVTAFPFLSVLNSTVTQGAPSAPPDADQAAEDPDKSLLRPRRWD